MKIAIIIGTRPEIIKMCPIIRLCETKNLDYFILHTGQHYSYELDRVFFEELRLPTCKYNLDVGSDMHGKQTANILTGVEEILIKENPSIVLIQGDTNTVMASALSAYKLGIKIGHIEAGLRSYDKTMPEEINRVVADHCSDFLFIPTGKTKKNLLKEGITEGIHKVGNTVVDSLMENKELAKKSDLVEELDIKDYAVSTFHRQENVDHYDKLKGIIDGLGGIGKEFNINVIIPMHPRTQKMIKDFNIKVPNSLNIINPISYLEFLHLMINAKLILTDSGGVQEEACVLKIPCITLRENTERPETIDVGSNMLSGTNPDKILETAKIMIWKKIDWENPFGDGKSSERILDILINA